MRVWCARPLRWCFWAPSTFRCTCCGAGVSSNVTISMAYSMRRLARCLKVRDVDQDCVFLSWPSTIIPSLVRTRLETSTGTTAPTQATESITLSDPAEKADSANSASPTPSGLANCNFEPKSSNSHSVESHGQCFRGALGLFESPPTCCLVPRECSQIKRRHHHHPKRHVEARCVPNFSYTAARERSDHLILRDTWWRESNSGTRRTLGSTTRHDPSAHCPPYYL